MTARKKGREHVHDWKPSGRKAWVVGDPLSWEVELECRCGQIRYVSQFSDEGRAALEALEGRETP